MSEALPRRCGRAIGACVLAGIVLLGGCAVGPDYEAPKPPAPAAWKSPFEWTPARPDDASPKGEWWRRYDDPELSRLEDLALASNTTLAVARTQLTQARAQATIANAALLPEVDVGGDAFRSRLSASRPTGGGTPSTTRTYQNQFDLPLTVKYEVDLFGGLRRGREQAYANAQAAAADLENAHLVVTAEVASDYFVLREADAEVEIDAQTVAALDKAVRLVRERHRVGTASGLDLAAQEAELAGVQADLAEAQANRANFENALAVLCGVPAPDFGIEPRGLLDHVEAAKLAPPGTLPSALLERRPDVAAAERRVAAANASIGVARSAYFPQLNLAGAYGYQSVAAPLIAAPNLAWSIGAAITAPVFDGGRRRAGVEIAEASYEASLANYRETALNAFADTEDALSSLHRAAESERARRQAVTSGELSLSLATKRYEVGVASYLDVVTAQQTLLANERGLAQAITRQRLASVLLVKSLGGDY